MRTMRFSRTGRVIPALSRKRDPVTRDTARKPWARFEPPEPGSVAAHAGWRPGRFGAMAERRPVRCGWDVSGGDGLLWHPGEGRFLLYGRNCGLQLTSIGRENVAEATVDTESLPDGRQPPATRGRPACPAVPPARQGFTAFARQLRSLAGQGPRPGNGPALRNWDQRPLQNASIVVYDWCHWFGTGFLVSFLFPC